MAMNRLALRKLVVLRSGREVYNQDYHDGVNIIRGVNGAGKSTIADFIFYILGGEIKEWKEYAHLCDRVVAELQVCDATISLSREVAENPPPISIFFGPLSEAAKRAFDQWQTYPMRRSETRESFSQIMFRALGIPEAKGDGGSNITIHQLLRLLYADQMSPVQRLFRFESFDPPITRQAVGEILCGVGDFGLYEKQIQEREVRKQHDEVSSELSAVLKALPPSVSQPNPEAILGQIAHMGDEQKRLYDEIARITAGDEVGDQTKQIDARRKELASEIAKLREGYAALDGEIKTIEYEISDGKAFIEFLDESLQTLDDAVTTHKALGVIKFKYCPSCFTKVEDGPDGHCFLCKSTLGEGATAARLLEIKTDLQIQRRESSQLLADREQALSGKQRELKALAREHLTKSREFDAFAKSAMTSHEVKLAELNQRIGFINGEIRGLQQLQELAERISALSADKAELQKKLSTLRDSIAALERQQKKRREQAYSLVSEQTKQLLMRDIPWQIDFQNPEHVQFSFEDDTIFVDGKANFSASALVILKNSFHLALLLASLEDSKFWLPRFMLFDNIEDKGMKSERSHNFQKVICEFSEKYQAIPHQIIFTTSMISPELNEGKYTVGPEYLAPPRTLNFS